MACISLLSFLYVDFISAFTYLLPILYLFFNSVSIVYFMLESFPIRLGRVPLGHQLIILITSPLNLMGALLGELEGLYLKFFKFL